MKINLITILLCIFFISKKFIFQKKYDEKIYIGSYTDGFESGVLKDKKTGQEYFIYGDNNIMLPLIKEINDKRLKTKEPYITVNLVLKGIDEGKAKGEIAEKNDRDLKVVEIINISF